jgi:preprotein translocase subunit SecG
MMGVVIAIHVIACIGLIILVLVQRGKGGGLVESFSGLETMFGTKTSSFLTRSTTILSVVFFVTCISLALLSIRQSKSLLKNYKADQPAAAQKTPPAEEKVPAAVPEAPKTP